MDQLCSTVLYLSLPSVNGIHPVYVQNSLESKRVSLIGGLDSLLEYGTGICRTELADWNVGLEHHKQKLLTYVHCKNERVNVLGLSQLQLNYAVEFRNECPYTDCLWYLVAGISKDLFYLAQVTCTTIASYSHLWATVTEKSRCSTHPLKLNKCLS